MNWKKFTQKYKKEQKKRLLKILDNKTMNIKEIARTLKVADVTAGHYVTELESDRLIKVRAYGGMKLVSITRRGKL